MVKPVLSICIPTYQRREALKATLGSLIEATRAVAGDVEICVSDNGSTDGTYGMLQELTKQNAWLRIRRNTKNQGYDANFLAVLKMAKGEYCWTVGDDDTVLPDAVLGLVERTKRRKGFTMGLVAAGTPANIAVINALFPREEYKCDDFITRLSALRGSTEDQSVFGFMSCYIFDRKVIEEATEQLAGGCYGWPHFALFLYSVSRPGGRIFIVHSPPIIAGLGAAEATKIFLPDEELEVFFTGRMKALTALPLDNKLAETVTEFLKRRGSRIYVQGLVRLVYLKGALPEGEYHRMKARVHAFGTVLGITATERLLAASLKIIEAVPILRIPFAATIERRSGYLRMFRRYREGTLSTNSEREGKVPTDTY